MEMYGRNHHPMKTPWNRPRFLPCVLSTVAIQTCTGSDNLCDTCHSYETPGFPMSSCWECHTAIHGAKGESSQELVAACFQYCPAWENESLTRRVAVIHYDAQQYRIGRVHTVAITASVLYLLFLLPCGQVSRVFIWTIWPIAPTSSLAGA